MSVSYFCLFSLTDVDNGLRYKYEMHMKNATSGKCFGCIICCFKLLFKFNMHSVVFTNLYLAYEFILTLSFVRLTAREVSIS